MGGIQCASRIDYEKHASIVTTPLLIIYLSLSLSCVVARTSHDCASTSCVDSTITRKMSSAVTATNTSTLAMAASAAVAESGAPPRVSHGGNGGEHKVIARLRNNIDIIRALGSLANLSHECWVTFSSKTGMYIQAMHASGSEWSEIIIRPCRFDRLDVPSGSVDYFLDLTELTTHLALYKEDKNSILDFTSSSLLHLDITPRPSDAGRLRIEKKRYKLAEKRRVKRRSSAVPLTPPPPPPSQVRNGEDGIHRDGGGQLGESDDTTVNIDTGDIGMSFRLSTHSADSVSIPPPYVSRPSHACIMAPDILALRRNVSEVGDEKEIHMQGSSTNLGLICRASAVVNETVTIHVKPSTRHVVVYSNGEKGEHTEEFTCEEYPLTSLLYVAMRTSSNSTRHDDVDDDEKRDEVSESYSNRAIKCFSGMLTSQRVAHVSFSPGRPLMIALELDPSVRVCTHISAWSMRKNAMCIE